MQSLMHSQEVFSYPRKGGPEYKEYGNYRVYAYLL